MDKSKIKNIIAILIIVGSVILIAPANLELFTSFKSEILTEKSSFLAKTFFNFIILTSLYLNFKKHINFFQISLTLLLGIIFAELNLFEQVLHPILEDYGVLRMGSNSQYTKILFSICPIPVLIFSMRKRTKRSFSRSLFLLNLFVVFSVTYLYHNALPGRLLKVKEKDQLQLMKTISTVSPENFKLICEKQNWICIENPKEIDFDERNLYQLYKEFNIQLNLGPLEVTGIYEFESEKPKRFVLQYSNYKEKSYRLIIDNQMINDFKDQVLISFYTLQYVLTAFWSFFSILLIYFHSKRNIKTLY